MFNYYPNLCEQLLHWRIVIIYLCSYYNHGLIKLLEINVDWLTLG